ncbi:FAD/NAD(P)-binding protein [Actinomadura rubrisoli]|uniref:FAD/NAD(P)-binding protein n=1 Tax=Actinomadura rubrisoli TaxID=2530368 RepID=A0A4R5BBL9_9ACTN|nr:FAD/NAD(P)-binding protein [Actinomadura rubrisoli]TDD83848.1 FAD/NAD(P)-binding protein [Actinomadura rubrisoli]
MNDAAAFRGQTTAPEPHRIAVVGSGPRGMGVLERITARLVEGQGGGPVEIYLIDAVEVGCGRVWSPDQPEWFLMNTVAGEVTMFSGPPDDGPVRPGAGPSLAQWWASLDPECPGADGYAPRALHSRYMRFLLEAVERSLPSHAVLHRVVDFVEDIEPAADAYRLSLRGGEDLIANKVVLTTGHTLPELTGAERHLAEFARERPELTYIRGDCASDMPFGDIPSGAKVGVIGMGLSFFDVMFALTVGRDGKFLKVGDGEIIYQPSGQEPLLVAGSRSGVPIPARGRNQKGPAFSYRPVLFTPERVRRSAAGEPLDFRADVLPWLTAEMNLVYHAAILRNIHGESAAARFVTDVTMSADQSVPDLCRFAAEHGIGEHDHFDFEDLCRPFARRTFTDPAAFHRALAEAMRDDLARAERGNVDDPLKAALDVIRDTRWVIRLLVDFGGLRAESHRRDFIEWFSPRTSFLAAGPPNVRLRYALALMEAGLLRVVGPETRFHGAPQSGRFVAESDHVTGSRVELDAVIDARIPSPDVRRDTSPLTRKLLERGVWTEFVNISGAQAFPTGGVAVTRSPFHPVGRDGHPNTDLYVLGVPTEHTRWVTLVGSGRPGPWNEFIRDADAIAEHALAPRD